MRVQLILEAVDRASRIIQGVHQAANALNNAETVAAVKAAQERAAQAYQQAQSNLVGAIATAASVAAPIGKAVGQFNAYEDVLTDVGLKADLTGVKLAQLGERARAQARALNTSSIDLLGGLNRLVEGGLALAAAEPVNLVNARAAVATKASIEDLGRTAVAVINSLKVLPQDYGRALDAMARGGKEGQAELADQARYFPKLGAQYAAMGQTGVRAVADLTAALQVVRGQTGSAEAAAAGLEDVLNKMTLGPAKKAFEELGIDVVAVMSEAQKTGRVIETIVETLQKATGGDASKISTIFGDKQALSAGRALMTDYQRFLDIREKALGGGGTVDADFLTRMGLGVEKVRALTVAFSELGTTLGQALAPLANAKAEQLVAIVSAIEVWAKANPELVATLASVATGVAGLMVGLALLGFLLAGVKVALLALFSPLRWLFAALSVGASFFGGLFSAISAGVAAVGGWGAAFALVAARIGGMLGWLVAPLALAARGFMALGAAMLASPFGWIVAGIAAVAAGAWLVWRNWDSIGPKLAAVWQTIASGARAAWDGLTGWLRGVGGRVADALAAGWGAVTAWFGAFRWPTLPSFDLDLLGKLKDVLDPVVAWVEGWGGRVLAVFQGARAAWDGLTGWLRGVGGRVADALASGWNAVTAWFGAFRWPTLPSFDLDLLGKLKDVLDPVVAWVEGWGGRVLAVFQGAIGKVTGFVEGAAGLIGTAFGKVTGALSTVSEFVFGPSSASVKATAAEAAAAKAAIDAIGPAAQAAVAQASAVLAAANFHSQGVAMMRTLAAGIRAGAAEAVAAVQSTVKTIRDHLPHSPARVGPLSDLDRVQFGQTLAQAITAGAPRAVMAAQALAAGLAATIPAGLPGPALAGERPGAAAPFAAAPGAGPGGRAGGGGSGAITVNLTLAPNLSGAGGGDFMAQLRAALPGVAHELAETLRSELDRRDRTKH